MDLTNQESLLKKHTGPISLVISLYVHKMYNKILPLNGIWDQTAFIETTRLHFNAFPNSEHQLIEASILRHFHHHQNQHRRVLGLTVSTERICAMRTVWVSVDGQGSMFVYSGPAFSPLLESQVVFMCLRKPGGGGPLSETANSLLWPFKSAPFWL